VFAARHIDVARKAAVKVLHGERALDPVARERFAREADAAARVRHPNVVPLLDAGVEGGVAYVVMDLLDGESLAAVLACGGPLAPARAARIGRDLASGLAAVHAQGVLHRDVKPANVVLLASPDGELPVLVDFGAAWLAAPSPGDALTHRGELIGTPRYMSPEQGAGEALDARTDLYALGVLLYECLTGRCPYDGPTWQATLLAASRGRCPSPRSLCPEVPAALDRVVRRAMAVDRDARYPDATALRDALDRAMNAPRSLPWQAPAALACGVLGAFALPALARAPAVTTALPRAAVAAPSMRAAPPPAPPPEAPRPVAPAPPTVPTAPPVVAPAPPALSHRTVAPARVRRALPVASPEPSPPTPPQDAAVASTRVLGRGAHGAWILAPSADREESP